MPLKDFTLDREFKISALFFLDPYNINENIFGDLFYTKDQIYIVLSSTVDSSSEIFTMYGFSDSGRLLVLNDCFVNHNRTPSAGFSRDRVIVNSFYILESTSIPLIDDEKITEKILNQFNLTQDDPLIADLKFNFECLNDLHNETLFKFNYEENENEDKEMLIVDDFNKIVNESYIENIKLNIKEKVLASLNYKKHDYHWSENFNFILSFEKNNMKFSEYMKYAKDIKNIYSYIAGRNLNFNDIQFTIKFEDMFQFEKEQINEESLLNFLNKKPQVIGKYFCLQNKGTKSLPLFIKRESSKIIHNFNDIITNWFKKRDQLIFIIESEVTDKGIPTLLESRLLNKIRNLEVFYRNFFREEQEDLQEYNDIKTEILTFIDKNIKNNEYKDSFKDKVNYKGEVSLRYKLVTLFKRLPQELAEIILKMEGKSLSGSRNKMAFSLKETRNYWTHGDTLDDYPKRLKGYDEIYPIYKKLIIIEKYFVLLELGVSEDLIINYLLTLYQKYANF